MLKNALDNILKLSFWTNFIYIMYKFIANLQIEKENSKIPSKSEEIINFC